VNSQLQQMERSFHCTSSTRTLHLRRRQRQRMGRSFSRRNGTRLMDRRRKVSIHQLERIKGLRAFPSRLSLLAQYHRPNPDRQHHSQGIHQSSRRYLFSRPKSTGNNDLEQLPPTEPASTSPTHSRDCKYSRSGHSISPVLPEEFMETEASNIHLPSESVGSSRCGPVCRSDHQSPATLRELEVESSSDSHGRIVNSMDPFPEPIREPTVESHSESTSKIQMEELPQITMVVPHWPSALWFPLLTSMAMEPPVLLDPETQTMLAIHSALYPWTNPNWKLSVWKLSGSGLKDKAIHNPLHSL
jgi:hypothetical protein